MSNPYPFDLDKAIAPWQRTMAYNRTFSAETLDVCRLGGAFGQDASQRVS